MEGVGILPVVTNGSQKIANDASGEVGGTTLAPDFGKSRADRAKEEQFHRGEVRGTGWRFPFVPLDGWY